MFLIVVKPENFVIYSVPARFYFSFGYIAYTKALFAIVPTSLRKGNAHLNIVQSFH